MPDPTADEGTARWVDVPGPEAEDALIWDFAHRYDGYVLHGRDLPQLGGEVWRLWHEEGRVDADVATTRAALFFAARAHRGNDFGGQFNLSPYVCALLARLRELLGGSQVPDRSSRPPFNPESSQPAPTSLSSSTDHLWSSG